MVFVGWCCGCQQAAQLRLPDLPEAKTLVVAGLREGAPPEEVWVSANDGGFDTTPLTFLDGAERYLLWHKRSLFRLGIPAGVQPIRPGAQAIPPDGALLAKDDGTWEVVPSPGALSGLPLYSPPDDCRLLNEGAIEPWPEVPPFSNAARTGPTTTLLGGDDGVLYHFNPQSGAEALADLGSPVRAVAYDGAGRAYALDARYRLHSVPLEGGAATVIQTSTANLGLAATSTTWTMAQLAVAWVLQNPNLGCALIGASRPTQVVENVAATGVVIPPEYLARIDEALGDAVVRNPLLTAENTPKTRPC